MGQRALLLVAGLGFLALVGCARKAEVISLNLQGAEAATAKTSEGLAVVVTSFEDQRPDHMSRLGVWHRRWDSADYLNVPGGKLADTMPKLFVEHLNSKGWRAQAGTDGKGADVVLSGKVLVLWIDADGGWFNTSIDVKSKITLQALNNADGSVVRMTINGDGTKRVFWFDPEKDAEWLTSEVLRESLDHLVANTKVENHILRLR